MKGEDTCVAAQQDCQHAAKVARKNLPFDSRTSINPANAFRKRGQPMMEFWLIFSLFCSHTPRYSSLMVPLRGFCVQKRASGWMSTAIVQRFYVCLLHLTSPFNDLRGRERRRWLFIFYRIAQPDKIVKQKNKYPRHFVSQCLEEKRIFFFKCMGTNSKCTVQRLDMKSGLGLCVLASRKSPLAP